MKKIEITESKIKIQIDDQTVELNMDEAKNLYLQLKKIVNDNNIDIPYIPPYNPHNPLPLTPYYSPSVIPVTEPQYVPIKIWYTC